MLNWVLGMGGAEWLGLQGACFAGLLLRARWLFELVGMIEDFSKLTPGKAASISRLVARCRP